MKYGNVRYLKPMNESQISPPPSACMRLSTEARHNVTVATAFAAVIGPGVVTAEV